MPSNTTLSNWYNTPLNQNDVIAGGTLIFLAVIFLPIYTANCIVLYRESGVITGFRYVLSASINNMLLLFNYALYPGLLILFKIRSPVNGRRLHQIYFNSMWFSMCNHMVLVAWTRYVAVCHPSQFRKQQNCTVYLLCFPCYVIALIQSIILYFQPWFPTVYYEASVYGLIADDLELYLKGGTLPFFLIYHALILVGTFIFYSLAIFRLFKIQAEKRRSLNAAAATRLNKIRIWNIFSDASGNIRSETKLIVPCICNAIIFLIGQVVIVIGLGESIWATWLILVLFALTASMDSITIMVFSSTVRKGTFAIFRDIFCDYNKKTNVIVIKSARTLIVKATTRT